MKHAALYSFKLVGFFWDSNNQKPKSTNTPVLHKKDPFLFFHNLLK